MTTTITKTSPILINDDSKAKVEPIAFTVGLIIGVFFTVISLIDLSVVSFGNIPFILQYYIWKANAPVVKPIITIITLLVPIAIIEGVISVYQIFTRKASKTRNLCDTLNSCAFGAIIFNTIVNISGTEEFILDSALKGSIDGVDVILPQFVNALTISVFLNLIMLIAPIVRFVDQEGQVKSQQEQPEVDVAKQKKND